MFGIKKYEGEALLDDKWYKYYKDANGRIVIDKGIGNIYIPFGEIIIRTNGSLKKVNSRGETIKEYDELTIKNNLSK